MPTHVQTRSTSSGYETTSVSVARPLREAMRSSISLRPSGSRARRVRQQQDLWIPHKGLGDAGVFVAIPRENPRTRSFRAQRWFDRLKES